MRYENKMVCTDTGLAAIDRMSGSQDRRPVYLPKVRQKETQFTEGPT